MLICRLHAHAANMGCPGSLLDSRRIQKRQPVSIAVTLCPLMSSVTDRSNFYHKNVEFYQNNYFLLPYMKSMCKMQSEKYINTSVDLVVLVKIIIIWMAFFEKSFL